MLTNHIILDQDPTSGFPWQNLWKLHISLLYQNSYEELLPDVSLQRQDLSQKVFSLIQCATYAALLKNQCPYLMGMPICMRMLVNFVFVSTMGEIIRCFLQTLNYDLYQRVAMTCSAIGKHRNDVLWRGKDQSAAHTESNT